MSSNGTKSGTIETGEISTHSSEAIAPDFPTNGAVSPLLNSTKNGGQNQEVHESGLNQDLEGASSFQEFFDGFGIQLLTRKGESTRGAYSMMGKLRQVFRDPEAARLVRLARDKSNPKDWLAGCIRNRERGRAADVALSGKDYTAGIPHGEAA
jgi:hypothetical protein